MMLALAIGFVIAKGVFTSGFVTCFRLQKVPGHRFCVPEGFFNGFTYVDEASL